MNNHLKPSWLSWPNWKDSRELTRAGLVAGLYIVLTFLTLPYSFGLIQFRLAETLNLTSLYNKRYVYALTLGVFIVNAYQYGPVDMIVGSLQTLLFLWLARWIGDLVVAFFAKGASAKTQTIIRYAVLTLVFSLSMFVIALEMVAVGAAEAGFWAAYTQLFTSELVMLTLGSVIMYYVSQRVDLERYLILRQGLVLVFFCVNCALFDT